MEPLQKYSESLFVQLDKALRKVSTLTDLKCSGACLCHPWHQASQVWHYVFLQELDKNEFHNVSLLLKCVQLYLKSDLQQGMSLLIEQGLVDKMSIMPI